MAPHIITSLSEYLRRTLPTTSLETNADTPIVPTSTPMSLSLDPKLAR